MPPLFPRWRRGGMHNVVEAHFWSLTRYRVGRRFLGLDYADNIILFPAYRRKVWGGWAAVTLGAANSSGYMTSDTSAVNVLEDGYPLHWRASAKLQAFIAEETRIWQARREEAMAQRAAARVAANNNNNDNINDNTSSSINNNNNNNNSNGYNERVMGAAAAEAHSFDCEQNFRDALTIKCTSPGFAQRHLRLSRLATLTYKALYFYLWGIAISVIVQAYLLFRGWLNPPARQGLKNIEGHVLHIPKVIFSLCVSCVAWVAYKVQPLVDPLLLLLEEKFPQVNWSAASPEVIANKAQQLAGNEETNSINKLKSTTIKKAPTLKLSEQAREWWVQLLVALLGVFSLLCVL